MRSITSTSIVGSFERRNALPYRRLRVTVLLAFSLFHVLAFPLPASAQDAAPAAPATAAPAAQDPLAARQQIVRDRLIQLEDRMFRLTEKLKQTDPEQAGRLEKALRQSGELLIRRHMDQAIQALERSELAEAAEHQAAAEKALEDVLVLLTQSEDDELERQRELDHMNELREQVDKLLDRQLQLRARSDASERLAERLSAAAERLRGIIERQRAESQRGEASENARPEESQARIREDTEKLAGDLNPPSTRPGGDPVQHAAEPARRNLQDAADQMRSAEQSLSEGDRQRAHSRQGKALESLEKALESLEQAAKDAKPMESAEAAGQQRALEQDAGKLADSMHEPGGSPSPRAEGQNGEPPRPGDPAASQPAEPESQPPSAQTPGGDDVRRAQQHMKQAGNKLESNQPSEATPEQDAAIRNLEQARAELQETLDQLRREQQEQMLAGLEQRFRAMLIEQQAINATTKSLDERKENWTRSDSLDLASLSGKQGNLSGEAAKALNVLVEEGTSVVFPQIVEQVRDDMADAAKRIGAKQTGIVTRGIQAQIVETLEELIGAIEQRRKEGPPPPPEGQQAQGQGGESGETPLLPGSAELKLLRSSQMRVNKQTQTLAEAGERAAAEANDQARRLSDRQESLAEMARKMSERAGGH